MIAVFFGGRSCEHDISIITGLQTLAACRRPAAGIYIDTDGVWWTARSFDSVNAVRNKRFNGVRVHLRPGEPYLYKKNKRLFAIEAAVLCNHGVMGEDGSLQGLLELSGVPYTGSGVAASAVGMDKLRSKAAFERAGLKALPYMGICREERGGAPERIISELGLPVIVKPSNLGSSIGISIAHDTAQLNAALDVALEWDNSIIVEKALSDFKEVNCAVLGDCAEDVTVSETEQPVGWKEFLTFSDKYAGDVKSAKHKMPADIDDATAAEVKRCAELAFRAVGCSGVARVDFLVKDGAVYVNEINTIPGSLANALFSDIMSFPELIERLIGIAIRKKRRADSLKRVYVPVVPVMGK